MTSNCLGSETLSIDYFDNRVAEVTSLLKPVASIAGYKQYIPRVIIVLVISPEIINKVDNKILRQFLARL